MVSWASGGLGHDTVEPQCRQIQFVDERFNNPDRVVLRHVVIQAVRQQRSLPPVLAFTKRFIPPSCAAWQSAIPIQNFPQINYTSPASQSGRTWFSSTTNPRKPNLIPFVRSYCIARKCGTLMYVSVSS